MVNDHDPYGDRNAVPFSQDQAGPGCWQYADCGLIVSLNKKECPSCTDTGAGDGVDDGGDSAPTAQPSLAAYGAGGQSNIFDLDALTGDEDDQ